MCQKISYARNGATTNMVWLAYAWWRWWFCWCEVADAATYVVGDTGGWGGNVTCWPDGKTFQAIDTFVFNYDKRCQDVAVMLDKAGYDACNIADCTKFYRTGKDEITLAQGPNYFISSLRTNCNSGMKMTVIAN